MDLDHYHRRAQMNILSPNVQYHGSLLPSSCTDFQMPSYDGLPRIPLDQSLLNNNWEQNCFNYDIEAPSMSSSQPSVAWPTSFEIGNTNQYYSYNTGIYEPSIPRDEFGETPRTLPCGAGLYNEKNMSSREPYETSSYVMELNRQGLNDPCLNHELHDAHESAREFARLSISPSAKAEDDGIAENSLVDNSTRSRNEQSEASDDGLPSSREMTAVEAEEHGADEPYAKLIYRALMSAPDHSMVLQEIYQWFRENTTKGSSDSKGWMNSIRHNLSMNAAFKKTERRNSSDETKKSTEWVLEDFAIKDGVQSTTRYRKGTSSKKFVKSDAVVTTRQAPSRKGGFCGSKAKLQRQRTKDDRSELRHAAYPRPDGDRRHHYNLDYESIPHQIAPRQISPLTPTHKSISSGIPFFYPHPNLKHENGEISYDNVPSYSLEEVHSVCEDGPVFSHERFLNNSYDMCDNSC